LEVAPEATDKKRVTLLSVPGPQADRVTTARHLTLEFEKKLF
jgi:hypothetical protein